MPIISVVGEYTLLTKGNEGTREGELDLVVPGEWLGDVNIKINFSDRSVLASVNDIEVSCDIQSVEKLSKYDAGSFPDECLEEFKKISSIVSSATHRALDVLRCFLRLDWISETPLSSKGICWFNSAGEKIEFPRNFHVIFGHGGSYLPINAESSQKLQRLIDDGVVPLRAFRHLHRAKIESEPHHKWIDATIAAELAIKEVLCLKCSALEDVLVECPSPPLDKLYGVLSERYLGERSPYLKEIREGVSVRNRIMHRHNADRVDRQDAVNYVSTIEAAIFHLLTMIYPGDSFVAETYMLAKFSQGVPRK